METSINLRRRFVSDNNLPIQILDEPYFTRHLETQEPYNSALTKWNALTDLIVRHYNSNENLFLEAYYTFRNYIIEKIMAKDSYKEFLLADMSKYKIDKSIYPSGSIYVETNNNSQLISVDLQSANFQALSYFNPDIVDNCHNYRTFIRQNGINPPIVKYIEESKYSRQVIFGKLNPSRQITIEKYIMSTVIEKILEWDSDVNIIYSGSDEIVIKYDGDPRQFSYYVFKLNELIMINCPFMISVEGFNLKYMKFLRGEKILTTYVKTCLDGREKLQTVPTTYFPQVYKLWKGIDIDEDTDLFFYYDGELAKFVKPLKMIKSK